MRNLLAISGLFIVGHLLTSCSKPSLVGSELLEDELTEVVFTDTLDLNFTAGLGDSVLAYSTGQPLNSLLCGKLDDPIFGESSSEIFTQFRIFNNAVGLIGSTIDEDDVTLRLRYDTSSVFGHLDEEVTIEVFEMLERPMFEEFYFTDHVFQTTMNPIGSATFVPKIRDSVEVEIAGEMRKLPPHAAIPITDFGFRERMFNADTAILTGIDTFQTVFKGLNIRMTSASNTMLAFLLSSGGTSLQVEYTPVDGVERLYEFLIDPVLDVKTVHFEHDYTGSFVEPYIGNTALGEDLLFVQSMQGLDSRMEVTGLDNLGNILINHAEIIVYEASLPEDTDTVFSKNPLSQIVSRIPLESGRLVSSRDVNFSLALGSLGRFGGAYNAPEEGNNAPGSYVMNTTAQLQAIAKGEVENAIYLSAYLKASQAQRVVLYGPGHEEYPARLRVTYTKVVN